MFEKEAEEWVKENMDCCRSENCTGKDIPYFDEEERCCAKSAFQKGAEFGYNKANEWHYVFKKDYPKDFKDIWICFITEEDMKDYVRGWYEYDIELDEHYFKTSNDFGIASIKNVYAWMPLVPPKEIKEND